MKMDPLDAISVEIRNKRKEAGVSQKRLGRLIRMSQSTIARLESDIERLNPSYDTVYKVIDTLDNLNKMHSKSSVLKKHAKEIMHRKIISVNPETTLAEAIRIMKANDFTQLPVISKNGQSLGAVYQKTLVAIATQNPGQLERIRVKGVLEAGLPQVDVNTELNKIRRLLEQWDAILVVEKSRVVGIITIYDVLKII